MDICRERKGAATAQKNYLWQLCLMFLLILLLWPFVEGGGAAVAQENVPQYSDDIGGNSHSSFFYGYLRRAAVALKNVLQYTVDDIAYHSHSSFFRYL
jgi:hypothetical protein